jgi:hypothetical protein
MNTIEILKEKAILLNKLSTNEDALFDYINKNQNNLEEVISQYKPERDFRPVNTLRFLIANELKKGAIVDTTVIEQLKAQIENRDVSAYYQLNDSVQQSLIDYKDSKVGMFPNWKHTFKILFPFIHSSVDNEEVKKLLNQLADDIIEVNKLENVTKHIVSFQGSQNYGSDRIWVAVIPESAPSVQYAYQIFFTIDLNGLAGGLHKGHNLTKQEFQNQDLKLNKWGDYLEHTRESKAEWDLLNGAINFLFLNDEKVFIKALKKIEPSSLPEYFNILDRLKEDLDMQDEQNLVFSIARNRLSFQVGKRVCFNVNKKQFDFISYNDLGYTEKENFTGSEEAFLYYNRDIDDVLNNYEDIKNAVEIEIERDNHALAKTYDNSAFRKAVFDKEYREKILNESGMKNKHYLVGAYWGDSNPKNQTDRFVKNSIWVNGYEDKFIKNVQEVPVGSFIAIKSAFTREKTRSVMAIKARGIVTKNLNDGKILEIEWDKGFVPFEVSFGGYLTTIKEVKKDEHIKAIWTKDDKIMKNVKGKFIEWYIANTRSSYFNNQPEKINDYLSKSVDSFSKNIFLVNSNSYQEMILFIEETINNNKPKFLKNNGALDSGKLAAIVGKRNYQKFLTSYFSDKYVISSKIWSDYKAPLNQIFYGPPGTGKTYNTILEAAKIIEQDDSLDYAEAQEVFNNGLGDNIEFITFHQNYSYEDFIQGLRPDTELSGELSFFKSDGVFKRIADRALKNLKESKNPESAKKEFEEVFSALTKPLNEGDVDELVIKMKQTSFYITEIGEKSIEFRKNQGDSKHTLSINTLRKMYESGANNIILGGLQPYYNPILNLLLENGKLNTKSVEEQNYVIIIDEINRANISRVFGELITLIEKDKRFGGTIPLTATLPSGEKFIVPSNLYIIGTMNTADKSIALLDIALRRRFEFVAMYPKYELENTDLEINDTEILKKLNKEIISRKGYDFTIGHSYFMGEDYKIKNTIDTKVIPLLLEYFMNDFEEVKKILQAAGLVIDGWPMKLVKND